MKENEIDERTVLLTENLASETQEVTPEESVQKKSFAKKAIKTVAIGGVSGILIGGASSLLMSMTPGEDTPEDQETPEQGNETSECIVGDVGVAEGVNDDLTFAEAFAAARAEVGPGGVFEWHGQLYGTYTAAEWGSMSDAERAEFGSNFNWNAIDTSDHQTENSSNDDIADDPIEIVDSEDEIPNVTDTDSSQYVVDGVYDDDVVDDEVPDVEVYAVVHDEDTGMNAASLEVDGEPVVLVDIDGDTEFDSMCLDLNQNGNLEMDEMLPISGISVNDLGGFTNSESDYGLPIEES